MLLNLFIFKAKCQPVCPSSPFPVFQIYKAVRLVKFPGKSIWTIF